eukprot:TRINITY_DN1335_c1_g5_i1.p1 TRINITY_DN1335_c1_g5~~TRINITY_DN1335_c1_g5_i1.p1  ORF type:complete len:574 (-),score=253.67 TRINITY_DN1335_c1_g5_i1:120-1841(-)
MMQTPPMSQRKVYSRPLPSTPSQTSAQLQHTFSSTNSNPNLHHSNNNNSNHNNYHHSAPQTNTKQIIDYDDPFTQNAVIIQRWWRNKGKTNAKLRRLVKLIKHRNHVVKEILSTEDSYVKSLDILTTQFLTPLKRDNYIPKSKSEWFESVKTQIETIHRFHEELLRQLQNRVNSWSNIQKIGDLFLKLSPYLKIYREYCQSYNKASSTVEELRNNDPRVHNFLANTAYEHKMELLGLLIMPIQRIPRYRLLFTDLIKHTPRDHIDYQDLVTAEQKVAEIAEYINESIRQKENEEKNTETLLNLQRRFSGLPSDFINGKRQFVTEGILTKVCRKANKKRSFFLFSDLFLYAIKQDTVGAPLKVQNYFELNYCAVNRIEDNSKIKNAFTILTKSKSFVVFADSLEEKENWIELIEKTITICRSQPVVGRSLNNSTTNTTSGSPAPVWVPDSEQKECSFCNKKFTAINRRHHCRMCGKLVCGVCSDFKLYLENIGKQCRVCTDCFRQNAPVTEKKEKEKEKDKEKDKNLTRAKSGTNVMVKSNSPTTNRGTLSTASVGNNLINKQLNAKLKVGSKK